MLSFLEINGVEINADDSELVKIGVGVADGSVNDLELLQWILDKEE